METVNIKLDKKRNLIFDLAAMKAYQKVTGKSPLKPIDLNDTEQLEALLWACLIREDPEIKIEDMNQLITIHNVRSVQMSLMSALYAVMPEPTKGEEKQVTPLVENRPNGNGRKHGLLGAITSVFRKANSGG